MPNYQAVAMEPTVAAVGSITPSKLKSKTSARRLKGKHVVNEKLVIEGAGFVEDGINDCLGKRQQRQ